MRRENPLFQVAKCIERNDSHKALGLVGCRVVVIKLPEIFQRSADAVMNLVLFAKIQTKKWRKFDKIQTKS